MRIRPVLQQPGGRVDDDPPATSTAGTIAHERDRTSRSSGVRTDSRSCRAGERPRRRPSGGAVGWDRAALQGAVVVLVLAGRRRSASASRSARAAPPRRCGQRFPREDQTAACPGNRPARGQRRDRTRQDSRRGERSSGASVRVSTVTSPRMPWARPIRPTTTLAGGRRHPVRSALDDVEEVDADRRPSLRAVTTVRSAVAVRPDDRSRDPCRPGAPARRRGDLPRRLVRIRTSTSSGWSTMPRTRCPGPPREQLRPWRSSAAASAASRSASGGLVGRRQPRPRPPRRQPRRRRPRRLRPPGGHGLLGHGSGLLDLLGHGLLTSSAFSATNSLASAAFSTRRTAAAADSFRLSASPSGPWRPPRRTDGSLERDRLAGLRRGDPRVPSAPGRPLNFCQSPVTLRIAMTGSVGCAPTPSQYCARSESTWIRLGSRRGW